MAADCTDVLDFPNPLEGPEYGRDADTVLTRIDGPLLAAHFDVIGHDGPIGVGTHDGVLDWFVSDAEGRGVVFFSGGFGARHRLTFADGREAELHVEVAQDWTLTDTGSGALLIHARATWGTGMAGQPAWRVAQDGSLSLLTVAGVVAVLRRVEARKQRAARAIGNL